MSYGDNPNKLTLDHSREVWSLGGDFGDSLTDAEFLLNGIFSPDRKLYPSFYEAKKVQQNVWFEKTDQPLTLKVSNRFDFTNLSTYQLIWKVKNQTGIIEKGVISLD